MGDCGKLLNRGFLDRKYHFGGPPSPWYPTALRDQPTMGSIPAWSSLDTSGDIRQRPFRARLRHQMPGRRALQPEVSMDENPLEKNGLNWKIMGK